MAGVFSALLANLVRRILSVQRNPVLTCHLFMPYNTGQPYFPLFKKDFFMKYSRPPDTYDVLPIPPPKEKWLHTAKWRYVEGVFRDVCRRYGYREIRTPILELTELFKRTAGEATDIVSKEMFTFVREGSDRSLTMKPEGTAPVARACLQENLLTDNPILKMYYIGQNFRYERGQKGRYRQHQQLGVEAFGAEDPAIDAEVITLAMDFYRTLGITEMELRVNSVGMPDSRAAYKDALREYVRPFLSEMSGEGQHRFEVNPLRMLDTKNPNDLRLLADAPKLTEYLDDDSRAHFDTPASVPDGPRRAIRD